MSYYWYITLRDKQDKQVTKRRYLHLTVLEQMILNREMQNTTTMQYSGYWYQYNQYLHHLKFNNWN